MKVESATQNYQAPTFNSKFDFIKPAFKANVSDEFITTVAHNAGDTGNTVGWIAGALALLGSGFAFFRNRKANIDRKLAEAAREAAEKAKLEAEENAKKLEQELEKWNKSVDENIKNILNEPRKSQGSTGKKSDGLLGINKGNHSSGSHAGNSNGTNSRINSGDKSGSYNNISSNNETNVNASTNSTHPLPSTATSESTAISSQQENNIIKSSQVATQNGKKSITDMTIDEIMQEQKEWQENFNRKVNETMKALEENKEVIEFSWSTAKRNELNNAKGFKRILGYRAQKSFLINKLINPIKNKQEIPSLVLMYGPKGTGKTLFSKAVAHEANAEYIKLDLMLDEQENLAILKNAAETAKQTFEKTGKSTILHLDEIDGVVCDEKYADLLSNLSKQYHATLIATTNHPKEINPIILNAKNSERMYIPPANQNDIGEILKYVLKDFAEPSIDYNKYAKMIIDNGNGSAYSNAKIYELADNIVNKHYGEIFNKKVQQKISSELVPVSEQEIRNAIENNLQPDITKETLETYKKVF